MKIMNTFFQHKNSHKYTWAARGQTSIIDYIVCNTNLSVVVLDMRVYRGPETESDSSGHITYSNTSKMDSEMPN
jgi:hypothetical protein